MLGVRDWKIGIETGAGRDIERKTYGVPGPICNGTVDDCCEEEYEDHGGQNAAAICYSANGQSWTVDWRSQFSETVQYTHTHSHRL